MACGHIATATGQELLAKSLADARVSHASRSTHEWVNLAAEVGIRTFSLKNLSIDQRILCGLAPQVYKSFDHTVESSVLRVFRAKEQTGHDKVCQIDGLIEVGKGALLEPFGPMGFM